MCEGRGSGMIARVVALLEAHGGSRHSTERPCVGMSPACISGMERHLPLAKVVFDKFHVSQLAKRAMEAVRRLERQEGVEDLKLAPALADGRGRSVSGADRAGRGAGSAASEDGGRVHDQGGAAGDSLEPASAIAEAEAALGKCPA